MQSIPGSPMTATPETYAPSLEGVIVGDTAISTVEGGLRYRGYPVTELAEQCCFEEVAYLLLYGTLPNPQELTAFKKLIAEAMSLPSLVTDVLRKLPAATLPMD